MHIKLAFWFRAIHWFLPITAVPHARRNLVFWIHHGSMGVRECLFGEDLVRVHSPGFDYDFELLDLGLFCFRSEKG